MPITRTVMIDDDGSGTTGTIINNAWKQEFYNQIDTLAGGAWVDVPYSAGNFGVGYGGGVWTVPSGSQTTYRYALTGNIANLLLSLGPTTISGAAGAPLNVRLPNLVVPARSSDALMWAQNAGVVIIARLRILIGDPIMQLYPLGGSGNWELSAGATYISGQFVVAI